MALLEVEGLRRSFYGVQALTGVDLRVTAGTITGLIRTFGAIGEANPAEQRTKLSEGIAEAMYNTAFGLSIALLCMVGHLLLSSASKKVISDLEAFSLRFENLLAEGGAGASAARAPGAPTDDPHQSA